MSVAPEARSAASLVRVSSPDLEELSRAIQSGDVSCPFDAAELQACQLGHLIERLAPLALLDRRAVLAVLEMVIAERRERRGPEVELVWTGPEAPGSTARDTLVVVRRLFQEARRQVIVGGYSFKKGTEVLRPLHEAMRDRGVEVRIFLDVERVRSESDDVEAHVAAQVRERFEKEWTFGSPLPRIYYDPRTVEHGSQASLHAKCVVVDGEAAFLGSANFTERGHQRNVEVGVLVRDRGLARRLAAQWTGLVEAGLVRRYVPV